MARKNTGTTGTSGGPARARAARTAQSATYQAVPRSTAITAPPAASALVKPAATTQAVALPRLTHDQIASRAKAIWEKKGRPFGQDEQNWYQAEAELRAELQA